MCDVARTTSSAGASRSVRIVTALMTSSGPVQVSTDGRGKLSFGELYLAGLGAQAPDEGVVGGHLYSSGHRLPMGCFTGYRG